MLFLSSYRRIYLLNDLIVCTIIAYIGHKFLTFLVQLLLLGASMHEKSMVITSDHSTPHAHNQNTSVVAASSGAASSGAAITTTTTAIDGKVAVSKRFSFRRSSSSSPWTIDPRRILIFFATLSSMGTILLIYFTLSMTKLNGEDKASY